MTKTILLIIILLGGYYLATQSRDQTIMPPLPTPSVDTTQTTNTQVTIESSRYVSHRAGWEDDPTPRKVLFFYASWCSTCIPTDRDLQSKIGDIPSDVQVIRVNYNDPDTDDLERDLAAKYGVIYQHTFVQVDNAGRVVTKWSGGATKELLANLK